MTKKRMISIWIVFVLLFTGGIGGCLTEASAAVKVKGEKTAGDYKYRYSKEYKGIEITKYIGKEKEVYIPAMIENKPVKALARHAFYSNEVVEKVVFPDTIVEIGAGAFGSCFKLNNVTLPSQLRAIREETFSTCPLLTELKIPSSVKYIGSSAFLWSGLKQITIPASVREIDNWAFNDCRELEQVMIPENAKLEKIGEAAFSECYQLKTISPLPASLKKLGARVFDGSSLREIHFAPNAKIKELPEKCFFNCQGLREVDIPKNVTKIGAKLFIAVDETDGKYYYRHRVVKINILGGKIKTIEKDAFKGINKKAVFKVPSKYKKKYKKLLKKQSWFKATMKIQV